LKVGQDDQAQGILRQIRAGADVEALLASLTFDDHAGSKVTASKSTLPASYEYPFDSRMPAYLTEAKNPYLASILYERVYLATPRSRRSRDQQGVGDLPQMYHAPYHVVDLVDPKIESVRAAPWTRVTTDDGLVRQLLRLYFLLEYSFTACFHKDLFLEDMISGRRRFCSPALVNAVLAAASVSFLGIVSVGKMLIAASTAIVECPTERSIGVHGLLHINSWPKRNVCWSWSVRKGS